MKKVLFIIIEFCLFIGFFISNNLYLKGICFFFVIALLFMYVTKRLNSPIIKRIIDFFNVD